MFPSLLVYCRRCYGLNDITVLSWVTLTYETPPFLIEGKKGKEKKMRKEPERERKRTGKIKHFISFASSLPLPCLLQFTLMISVLIH